MKKFKFFLSFEKEENWLNQMAMQGYLLDRKSWNYHFKKADIPNTTFKIDYRKFKNQQDFLDYISMFEDSGWKHITGTKSSGVQYFKKEVTHSDDDIFSDDRSRAGRYKRISDMWLTCELIFVALFIVLKSQGMISIQTLFTPKDWYLTPGLWELNGVGFLWAFLFETPFALFRGCSWLLCLLFIIMYGVFAIKSEMQYKKSL